MKAEGGGRWDTGAIPSRQRFDAWQGMLQDVYGAWDVTLPATPDFNAEMLYRAVGGFQIVDCSCDPCGARRTRSEMARDGNETLTIQLVLSGTETFTIDDRRIDLGPGDVLIWNSIRPMTFEVTERLRKVSVTMPLSRLRSWLPGSWHSIESSLANVSPGAGLLSNVIGSISPEFLAGNLRNGEALTETMMGLLVNVLGIAGGEQPATLRAAQLLVVKDHIQANLANPDLSPGVIASGKRMSVRYLHALFENDNTTVQQYVIRQRLLRCRRELENPKMAGRTITEIAFAWGFQNSTHFSRRFKAEFGLSPQDCRSQAAAAAGRPAGAPAQRPGQALIIEASEADDRISIQ